MLESQQSQAPAYTPGDNSQAEFEAQRRVLRRLRRWHEWDENLRRSPMQYFLSFILPNKPSCPTQAELLSLTTYFFPLRANLKVTVCDFRRESGAGAGGCETTSIPLRRAEEYWQRKPDGVAIRWIHIPVGPGLVNDCIEFAFQLDGPPCPDIPWFENAGPILSTEITSIKAQEYLQDQLDIFNILRSFRELNAQLDELNLKHDNNSCLLNNIQWRQQHTDESVHFWDAVHSDLPWQLGEGIRTSIRDRDIRTNPRVPKQMLSRHPRYKGSVLVKDPFRFLYRGDGIIISLSTPSVGDNIVSNRLMPELATSPRVYNEINDTNSAIAHLRHEMASWASGRTLSDTEEFLIILITKVVIAPHYGSFGSMSSVWDAYRPIVRDLNSRRGSPFKRHDTVELVRQYVGCMDELSQIRDICEQKLNLLKNLAVDGQKIHSPAAQPGELNGEGVAKRVQDSIKTVSAFNDQLPRSLTELRFSLQVLFQLKTIEQNEIAIFAESNNKAILIFTIVTIVFLPLSFFTSYFGMNLQGIANTDKTQRDFWAICGSTTVFIVGVTVIFGFSERIYSFFVTIWQDGYVDERRGYRREMNQMVADYDWL